MCRLFKSSVNYLFSSSLKCMLNAELSISMLTTDFLKIGQSSIMQTPYDFRCESSGCGSDPRQVGQLQLSFWQSTTVYTVLLQYSQFRTLQFIWACQCHHAITLVWLWWAALVAGLCCLQVGAAARKNEALFRNSVPSPLC